MPTDHNATPEQSLEAGIDAANPEAAAIAKEVKRWAERVEKTRKHDDAARLQYARDRRYARGDSGFAVDANLVGTFIDILKAFLYAKDPDVDVLPAKNAEPPTLEALREAAEVDVDQDPRLQQAAMQAQQAPAMAEALAGNAVADQVEQVAPVLLEQLREQIIMERVEAMQAEYRRRQRDAKAFAETLELVIGSLWRKGRLKPRAKLMVGSGLTIGPGWLKATWQERRGHDALTRQSIRDLRDNINKLAAKRAELDEVGAVDLDLKRREVADQLAALEAKVEPVIARGFAIDFVEAEDMTVAPGVPLTSYLDAPWIDQRIPMLVDDADAEFILTAHEKKKLTRYKPRKPSMIGNESPGAVEGLDAKDADAFEDGGGDAEGLGEWCMVHETWDRDANVVRTWIEGLNKWVRPPTPPTPSSRFYGFFLLALGEVDGQRHPQSLVSRSAKLVEEYNRIGTAEREHRMRVKPKILVRGGQVGDGQMVRIVNGETAEFVIVETTQQNVPLSELFHDLKYPAIDPGLYDRQRIVNELERIWGVQEALAGSVSVAKTATEAEIQQGGMQARTGAQRDTLEDVLTELAQYTAEIAVQRLDDADAREIAGPGAMWPQVTKVEDLARLVQVEIRAGSSGKPNTSAEREAMAALLPVLQGGIQTIGMLRQSTPLDVADAHEALLRLVIDRTGERIDLDALLPKAGPVLPAVPGTDPNAPTGGEGAPLNDGAAPAASEPTAPAAPAALTV